MKDRPVWGSGAPANCTLAEAVHVSTNAPIDYFDAPAAIPSALDRFWDGGITGCNNPAVAATTEAITQDVAAADIRLLSIGTGTVYLPFSDRAQPPFTADRSAPSFVADLQKLARMSRTWPRGNSGTQSKVVRIRLSIRAFYHRTFGKANVSTNCAPCADELRRRRS